MPQQKLVQPIQHLVKIDKHLASIRCRQTRRFKVLKLRDPLTKHFDKSPGGILCIEVHHRLIILPSSSREHHLGAARDVVGIRRGAISGNMKVSCQAARSIG